MKRPLSVVMTAVLCFASAVAVKTVAASSQPPTPPMHGEEIDCAQPPMLEHLKRSLKLTAEQESKMATAAKQHCETMKASSQKMRESVKGILTAEQQAQLEKMHEDRGRRHRRDRDDHDRDDDEHEHHHGDKH